MSESNAGTVDIPSVDERQDDTEATIAVPYVEPTPSVGTAQSLAEEIADLRAQVAAQSLVINTLAASCDWMVQNLTQVFQFVASMQSAGGPAAMFKMMAGGNNG